MEPPLDRSTTWPYVDGEPGPFYYARNAHPAGVEAERALGELDGGEALLFSSGMGATTAIVLALLSPGSTVALAQDAYYGTGVLFGELERWGLRHVLFDQTGPPPAGRRPRLDRGAVEPAPDDARLRGRRGAPRPRRLRRDRRDAGAPAPARARLRSRPPLGDEVPRAATTTCCSARSSASGAEHAARLLELRTRTGIVAAPDAAWLLLRGLKTLEVRVDAPDRDGERSSPTGSAQHAAVRDRPLSRLRRPALLRRRRRRSARGASRPRRS